MNNKYYTEAGRRFALECMSILLKDEESPFCKFGVSELESLPRHHCTLNFSEDISYCCCSYPNKDSNGYEYKCVFSDLRSCIKDLIENKGWLLDELNDYFLAVRNMVSKELHKVN